MSGKETMDIQELPVFLRNNKYTSLNRGKLVELDYT